MAEAPFIIILAGEYRHLTGDFLCFMGEYKRLTGEFTYLAGESVLEFHSRCIFRVLR